MDLDALLARRPQLALVDELAHTNAAGQPPPEALHRRRGAARRRHRRLHDAQRPARREPQHRRGADHARARARDGARRHPRSRRRHRGDRHRARRPDPAAARGQGLRAAPGRTGAPALLLARQSHGAARARPAAHGAARRRPAARAHAVQRHRRPLGGRGARAGLRRRGRRHGRPGAPRQARRRPAARARRGAVYVETGRSLALERGRARRHRGGAAPRRAARRGAGHRADRRPPRRATTCWITPGRTTSTHILDRQDQARRAGSSGSTARWCSTWCAAPATSASTSSPCATTATARAPARGVRDERPSSRPTPARPRLVAAALGVAEADPAAARRHQHRPRVPHRRRRHRHLVGALSLALRRGAVDAGLQLLLPAAALHLHRRRSLQRRGAVLLHACRGAGLQPHRARAQPGDDRPRPRPHHRGALRLLAQARRLRRHRRRALGHGLPDRLHARGSRRGAAARGGASRRARRLPAGGRARGQGPRRRAMVVGAQRAGRARRRHLARRAALFRAAAHLARARRRGGPRCRQARRRC